MCTDSVPLIEIGATDFPHNKMRYGLLVFFWIGLAGLVRGQIAQWNFDASNNSPSSVAANISASNADFGPGVGTNLGAVSNYATGNPGKAYMGEDWNSASFNPDDYLEISITPNPGYKISVSSISFDIQSSATGPNTIAVRSSLDNFTSNVSSGASSTNNFGSRATGLGAGSTNITTTLRIRIYGYGGTNVNGTLRFDNITLSGAVALPVELLYFRAQPQGNVVALSWATTWERNAGTFTIQRSRDLSEFLTIGEVAATGNTDSRQTYAFTDRWPDAGTTYYRLLQTDRDGATQQARPVAVTLDDDTPALAILENPTTPENIPIATRNLTGATFRLISLTGQSVFLLHDNQANGSTILRANGVISAGLYWLQAIGSDGRTVGGRVLIR